MRAPGSSLSSVLWVLLLVAAAVLLRASDSTEAASCEACEAWEALEAIYNSTGNLTDVGYNKTIGGGGGTGGMNDTTSRNATVPMPNGTRVPSSTNRPASSHADYPFTAKTAAATLTVVILLLAV